MAPLSFAMNDLARSLGQADPYPFALRDGVVAKLDHIAQLVARTQ
ncbi:putative zinc-binding metallopeptidase [Streptomyces brasiliscabiei]